MALYRIVTGTMLLPALKGEAGRHRRANRQNMVNLQRQLEVFLFFFLCCASPFARERITGPTVLVQHKGNVRIGEALRLLLSSDPSKGKVRSFVFVKYHDRQCVEV
jgi:hypothetical protein